MTTTNDALSALTALRLAFDIVKTPCSVAETERAQALLGIAHELREEAQYRRIADRRFPLPGREVPPPAAPDFAAMTVPADPDATAVVPLDHGQRYQDGPEVTQRLRVPWAVGDKADCKHCRTPIELGEATFAGTFGEATEPVKVWRHKYTGQAVCVNSSIDQGHTFAEPSIE